MSQQALFNSDYFDALQVCYAVYAPIMAYLGAQGYMLDHEIRPGSQHCQKGNPEFLTHMLARLKQIELTDEELIRMDSGNDSAEQRQRKLQRKRSRP